MHVVQSHGEDEQQRFLLFLISIIHISNLWWILKKSVLFIDLLDAIVKNELDRSLGCMVWRKPPCQSAPSASMRKDHSTSTIYWPGQDHLWLGQSIWWNTSLKDYISTECLVDSKGFWRWCRTLRITGFLDFFHRPSNSECSTPSSEPFRIYWYNHYGPSIYPSFRKLERVFPLTWGWKHPVSETLCFLVSRILNDGKSPKTQ
jgi:hypothetical protein